MRNFIQSKLMEIDSVESGPFVPDDMIELNTTYFGYQLQDDFMSSDHSKNFISRVSLIGYVSRKETTEENTLQIVDDAVKEIRKKLKEINMRTSYKDVSIENGIRKIRITGSFVYNEINNQII